MIDFLSSTPQRHVSSDDLIPAGDDSADAPLRRLNLWQIHVSTFLVPFLKKELHRWPHYPSDNYKTDELDLTWARLEKLFHQGFTKQTMPG